jgi:hypothetical protein
MAFRFQVGDQCYSWHQPKDLVPWSYTLTEDTEHWDPEGNVKPVKLPAHQFANAKAWIRFVLVEGGETADQPGD